jgi:sugar-specific transcriptional regulator TrmB
VDGVPHQQAKKLKQENKHSIAAGNFEGSSLGITDMHDTALQTLIDLGLSSQQARVYLTLAESGPLKVATISEKNRLDRADVSRTLSKLQELSLVEKIIDVPNRFKAVPMKEGLLLLLKNKTDRHKELESDTKFLVDLFVDGSNVENEQDSARVILTNGKLLISKVKEAIESTQKEVDVILSWKRFSHGMVSDFDESIERASAKGVKFRFIVGKYEEGRAAKRLIQYLRKKSVCEIRLVSTFPETTVGIFDKKNVIIVLYPERDLPDSPGLLSNNPSIVMLAAGFFDALWSKAKVLLSSEKIRPTIKKLKMNRSQTN